MEEEGGLGSFVFNVTAEVANNTLTCAARSIQGPVKLPFNPYVLLVARCILTVYFMMVGFFGTVLNGFVLYLVCRYKSLRTLSFAFGIQVIISNIFGSLVLSTVSFANVLANQWLLGEIMCRVIGAFRLGNSLLKSFLLAGLVSDRFFSIFFAFSYPRHRVKVMWLIGVSAYLIPAAMTVILGVLDCMAFSSASWICRVSATCSPQCTIIRQVVGFALFFPPRVIPAIMYTAMYCKGRMVRRTMEREMRRVSASEAHNERRENRATVTFFLMFFSLVIVTLPPGLVINIVDFTSSAAQSPWFYILNTISLNFLILAFIADPIFILRNKDVRDVYSKINWIPFLKTNKDL